MPVDLAVVQDHLAGPMVAFWLNGDGPTETATRNVIDTVGIQIPEQLPVTNKARLVRAAYAATETAQQALRLTQKLYSLLRQDGALHFLSSGELPDLPPTKRVAAERTADLRNALLAIGGNLTEVGIVLPEADEQPSRPPRRPSVAEVFYSNPLTGPSTRTPSTNFGSGVTSPPLPDAQASINGPSRNDARRVFLVHGRDSRLPEVQAFLYQHGLRPTVLQEEASGGLTIIEKFEREASRHSHVVVLATGDDLANLRDSSYRDSADHGWVTDSWLSGLRPRARQNVVLELGYFYARPGREHVTILTDRNVELPSDVAGVGVVYLDNHWKYNLLRELKSAGLSVED